MHVPGVARFRERWLGLRNRLVGNPGFQRWAAGFPLTRGIARRNTRALFDLCAGFVYAQVLFACVELDLFRSLRGGALSVDELARSCAVAPDRMLRLLKAAASLDLLAALPDDRFALADLGAAMLGNPAIAAMVAHHAMLYADLADPVALLRGRTEPTRLAAYWQYADHARLDEADDASVAAYSALMGSSQALLSDDVLDACSLEGHVRLLDVGGGEGAFLAAAAHRYPHLELVLFDLPPVARRAAANLGALGLDRRLTCVGGSFHEGNLPTGADVISLVRVIHDHDDTSAQALLHAAFRALRPGGRLLLAEPMAGTPGSKPIGDAYFGFYLLAMGSGRARRAEELTRMLGQAGFRRVREVRTRRPLLIRLLTAERMESL